MLRLGSILGLLLLPAPSATAAGGTGVCVKHCLSLYDDSTLMPTTKDNCRLACKDKGVVRLRRTCVKDVKIVAKQYLRTCKQSLRGIKHGDAPLSVTVSGAASNRTTITYTYFYESGCVEDIKALWTDGKQTCNEILCANKDEYWNNEAERCVKNPYQGISIHPEANAAPPLPAIARGFYKFSWGIADSYQGPDDTNIGVTFTGRIPFDSQANIAPITNRPINLLAYGGGTAPGYWTQQSLDNIKSSSNLDQVIALTYDGIVIDAEVYASGSPVIPVEKWNEMFQAIKARNLILVVTLSHFKPYDMSNGAELVADWLQNPLIDYLSPQLYTRGSESQNDWEGYNPLFKSSLARMAPSIVQASYYDQLGANSVIDPAWLPNSQGYFVWSNTPPHPDTPTCVTGYFPGSSCAYMCQWCAEQLGTSNYYWQDSVCTWNGSGCTGITPQAGIPYTCCKAGR